MFQQILQGGGGNSNNYELLGTYNLGEIFYISENIKELLFEINDTRSGGFNGSMFFPAVNERDISTGIGCTFYITANNYISALIRRNDSAGGTGNYVFSWFYHNGTQYTTPIIGLTLKVYGK